MASIVNQKTLIQRETTPGTAATNAMKQLSSMSMRPGWDVERNDLRAQGSKLVTVSQRTREAGTWPVEGIQDFNHLGLALASRIALPTTTTPVGATNARQHVFALDPDGEDTKATYTAQFGDTNRAIQAAYGVFNSLGINVQRGSLGFTTSFKSRTPEPIASIATTGVTTIPAAPTAARKFDIWADDAWADLGDTQLLAAYEGNIDLGEKFAEDTPINSSLESYGSLVEATDQSYGGMLRLGFDPVAEGLITTYEDDALKFIRIKATGPIIEAAIPYSFQLDVCVQIRNPGTVEPFNNGTLTIPFDFTIVPDPITGNAIVATLVNTVTAY